MGYTKNTYDTIDNVVKGVCADLGEGLERYAQYLHWALKAHKNWHLDQAKEIKTAEITLTPYKAIALPDDFVDWTKVGIRCGNTILTFTQDNYMPFPRDTDGDIIPNVDEDCASFDAQDPGELDLTRGGQFSNYYYNLNEKGQDTGHLFGLTAKDNWQGYFRLNKEREEIQFRSKITNLTTIYLEYISNGYDPCGESLVHPYAAHLISLWVHWQRKKHNKLSARWEVQDARQDYIDEFNDVQYRIFDLDVEEILEAWRDGYNLLPVN